MASDLDTERDRLLGLLRARPHPLLALLRGLGLKPCADGAEWLASLPPEMTPARAWQIVPDREWRNWLLYSVRDVDPRSLPAALLFPAFRFATRDRSRTPGRRPSAFSRALHGRCLACDGDGCERCRGDAGYPRLRVAGIASDGTGYVMPHGRGEPVEAEELEHPADAWTLPRIAAIRTRSAA